jgi:uncharacterized membrane protein
MWAVAVYASSFLFIMLITAQFIYAKSATALSPATQVVIANGEIRIPAAQINDADLHRYVVDIDGKHVRFWLVRRPDGSIATALDACEICGDTGFYKHGNQIICKNCAAPINPQSVGQAGGCNPIPLKAAAIAENVVITEADLAASARYFQH